MSNLESDSDSDSDYAPEADGNDEVEQEVEQRVSGIPVLRKRKAASLFEDMVAEENQAIEAKMLNTVNHQKREVKSNKAKRKKKEKLRDVMTTIFGSKSTTFKKFTSSARGKEKKKSRSGNNVTDEKSPDVLELARKLVKNTQKQVVVTETKKFAGQEISVERTLKPGSSQGVVDAASIETGTGKKDSSLDKVLQDIKGPQAISTVSKSSMDWDTYKDKEGLEEDLAGATKEGYLTRKDFLERCDVRAFEKERDQRLLNSTKK